MPKYIDPGAIAFDATILHGTKSACRFVRFPHSALETFGARGNVPVRVSFNGMWTQGPLYRSSAGNPHILLLRKAVREALCVGPGDVVSVVVKLQGSRPTPMTAAAAGPATAAQAAPPVGQPVAAHVQRRPTDKAHAPPRRAQAVTMATTAGAQTRRRSAVPEPPPATRSTRSRD